MVDDQLNEDARIQLEMQAELKKWQEEIGAPPGAVVTYDLFMIDCMLHALTNYLDDRGIIEDRSDFNNYVAQHMLTMMRQLRPGAKQAKLEALQRAIVPPGPRFDIPKNHKH